MISFPNPITPPQPDKQQYMPDALELFPRYTRDSIRAKFGIELPPFDPNFAEKVWADPSVGNLVTDTVVYNVIVDSTQYGAAFAKAHPGLVQHTMALTALEASRLNLTGLPRYATYVPAKTDATSAGAPVEVLDLSTLEDAQRLSAIFGTGFSEENLHDAYPPSENRRMYILNTGLWVGRLVALENAHGIGFPGRWNVAKVTFEPDAVPVGPAPDDRRWARAVPIRPMSANEVFETGMFEEHIRRIDKAIPGQVAGAGGGLSDADRSLVQGIVAQLAHVTTQVDTLVKIATAA